MEKLWRYLAIGLMVALVAIAAIGTWKYNSLQEQIRKKDGQLADLAETVKTKDGAFKKLTGEFDDLKVTNKELQKTIDKAKEDVVSAQQLAVKWEKKFNDLVPLVPVFVIDPLQWGKMPDAHKCASPAKEYRAEKDYGIVKAGCNVLTFDPDAQTRLTLEGGSRPLGLNIAVTRNPEKQWNTYVKVEPPDDQNLSVNIVSTRVNMEPLKLRWYEKVGVHIDIGVGPGVLGGAGLNYEFGQFNLGPSIWGVVNNGTAGSFYGLNFNWSPFKSTSP